MLLLMINAAIKGVVKSTYIQQITNAKSDRELRVTVTKLTKCPQDNAITHSFI